MFSLCTPVSFESFCVTSLTSVSYRSLSCSHYYYHLSFSQHFLPLSPSSGARWPCGLERWTGDRTVRGSNPAAENFSLRNFGNSVYPALPVSFGGDTKSRRSLLSGVYARGSKRSHQSALECVTLVDYIAHSKLPQK